MIEKTVGFIGGGRITRIILEGFERTRLGFKRVIVSDINPEALKIIKAKIPNAEVVLGKNSMPASGDLVFLALHPPAALPVLGEVRSALKPDAILISLAPKITMARISEVLGGFNRIVRMIPNAPSIVNAGYNPVAFGSGISELEKQELLNFLSALGECPEVKEENLESYAVLAAMGPTYFWFQWEELARLGEMFGLSAAEARASISRMIDGAAKTFFHSNLNLDEVMDLIPVRPLAEDEEQIRDVFRSRLEPLHKKLKS